MTRLTTIAAISMSSLLPASCHKAPVQTTKVSAPVAVVTTTNTALHDLGELALTNHYETIVQLGGGKDCIFTPKMIGRNEVQITLALESKTSLGKASDLSVKQIIAKSGQSFDVTLGDYKLTFTPKIISE